MVLASFLFATMGVGVKYCIGAASALAELVFYRGIVSIDFHGHLVPCPWRVAHFRPHAGGRHAVPGAASTGVLPR
jgi:cytochrome P450